MQTFLLQVVTLKFFTDFADQAVILPILLAMAIILAVSREWQATTVWLLVVPGVLGTILVLKVLCYACGWLVPSFAADRWDIRSPSGHVAAASVVYAAIIVLVTGSHLRTERAARIAFALLVSVIVAITIGVTRFRLGAHSMSEVLIAAAIGSLGAMLFAGLTRPLQRGRTRWSVVAALVLVWIVFHGINLPAEAAIKDLLGEKLRIWVVSCRPDGV